MEHLFASVNEPSAQKALVQVVELHMAALKDMMPQWTTERPTEPGQYWIREPDEEIGVVDVRDETAWLGGLWAHLQGDEKYVRLSESRFDRAEWAGPLRPPD